MRVFRSLVVVTVAALVLLTAAVGCMQRRLLYFPSHDDATARAARAGLAPWVIDGAFAGYVRLAPAAPHVWFVLHGNAGEAGDRGYIAARLDPRDSVYVLEYPGYGRRPGSPSRSSFDAAARAGYEWLIRTYGVEHVIVLGESLGSGPACSLATAAVPPRHIVLVVPFDVLTDVAQEKFPLLPVRLLMLDRWDNVSALRGFTGRLDIFGARFDRVIPVQHARTLARSVPGAVYHEFAGGHDWSAVGDIRFGALD